MQKRTSNSHFSSVRNYIAACRRYRDGKRLERYVQSDEFVGKLDAMSAADRVRTVNILTDAAVACKAKLDSTKPLPAPCSRRVRHTPELIAKVRRLAPMFLDDKEFAREVGMSFEAARAARYKFVGPKSKIIAMVARARNLAQDGKNSAGSVHAA